MFGVIQRFNGYIDVGDINIAMSPTFMWPQRFSDYGLTSI